MRTIRNLLTCTCFAATLASPQLSFAQAGDAFATQEAMSNPNHAPFVRALAKQTKRAWYREGHPDLPAVLMHADPMTRTFYVEGKERDKFDKNPETHAEVQAKDLVDRAASSLTFPAGEPSTLNVVFRFSWNPRAHEALLPSACTAWMDNMHGMLRARFPSLRRVSSTPVDVDFGPYMAGLQYPSGELSCRHPGPGEKAVQFINVPSH